MLNEANPPPAEDCDCFFSVKLGFGALANKSVESANCWFVGVEFALEVDEEVGAAPKGSGKPEDDEDEVLNLFEEENDLLFEVIAVWPPKAAEVDEAPEAAPNPPPAADEPPPVDDDDSTGGQAGALD